MIFAYPALILLGTILGSMLLTRMMLWAGPRIGLIDHPGVRRIHTAPVPRAGGVAVWISFMLFAPLVLLLLPKSGSLTWQWYWAFLFASSAIVLIGIVDDYRGLPARFKLAGQVVVASAFFFSRGKGVGLFLGYNVHWSVDLLLWLVWTVGIINAFNLIDGLDGLCGGMALISIGSLAIVSLVNGRFVDGLLMFVMMGSICGFLRYNFHPARIFLGDAGSMFLGFFIATAATASAGERAVAVSLLMPLLVAGVPFIDVALAIWRRTARKRLSHWGFGRKVTVFGADKDHLHHRLLRMGFSQGRVALLLYTVAILVSLLALLPFLLGAEATGITLCSIAAVGIVGFRYADPIELKASGAVLNLALKRPLPGRRISLGYFCYDTIVIFLALGAAFTFEHSGGLDWFTPANLKGFIPITMGCSLGGLLLARAQSRCWGRASLRDYWALVLWFTIAMQAAFTMTTLVERDIAWASGRLLLLTTVGALPALLLARSLTPLFREALLDSRHRRGRRSPSNSKRVVLYGAGDLGELFLKQLKMSPPKEMEEMSITGFLDDHPHLRGRILDGFRILGGVDDLEPLADHYDLHGVVLTATFLDPIRADQLNELCRRKHLTLYRWRPHLHIHDITPQQSGPEKQAKVIS